MVFGAALACVAALACSPAHAAIALDKATLRGFVEAGWSFLGRADIVVEVEQTDSVDPAATGLQRWRLAWDETALRWEECRLHENLDAPLDCSDPMIAIFEAASASGIVFDGAAAAQVGAASKLAAATFAHDYLLLMGRSMGEILGVSRLNDALALLADPEVVVRPELEEVEGYECVVVERRSPGAPLDTPPTIVAAFAPALGYAQVSFESRTPAGDSGRWFVTQFQPVADGSFALPIAGGYRRTGPDGALRCERSIAVALDETGAPRVVLGEPVDRSVQLPVGAIVHDVDAGTTSTLQEETLLLAGGRSEPCSEACGGPLRLAGLGLPAMLLCGGLLVVGLRRRSGTS